MELILSCESCGSSHFRYEKIDTIDTSDNKSYLYKADEKINKVTCSECGVRDSVSNLIVKVC